MASSEAPESEPSRPDYISPVSVKDLMEAAEAGRIDPGWKEIGPAELSYVGRWRAYRQKRPYGGKEPNRLAGLALSGGGIRSATFSLGIMQALAARRLLQRLDYISTVSGGGYIGSAVNWLVSEQARKPITECADEDTGELPPEVQLGMDPERSPFGTDDPSPDGKSTDSPTQRGLLRYLRQHGYYLTPGNGITIVSLLAVVLRGTLLNLLVWIPAFVLFFVFGLWASGQISDRLAGDGAETVPPPVLVILPRLLSALEPKACSIATPAGEDCAGPEELAVFAEARARLPQLLGFELFLDIAPASTLVLIVGTLVYSLLTWFRRGRTKTTFCFWYDARRHTEQAVAMLIPVALATLIIGTLPLVGVYLKGWTASAGPLAVLIGIGVTLRQFFSSGLSKEGKLNRFLVTLGAGLFLYGVFLVAYEIAFRVYPAYTTRGWEWLALVAWVGVFGWVVNLNYISVHRFYRDRLMETFMPG
jgi:hypothetical protein